MDKSVGMIGEQKIIILGRYIAKKSVFDQHGRDFCNGKSTEGKVAKKSKKLTIFRWKNRWCSARAYEAR